MFRICTMVTGHLLLAVLLAGCGARRVAAPPPPAPAAPPPEDELAPLEILHGDVRIDPPEWKIEDVTTGGELPPELQPGEFGLPEPGTMIRGFRVQIRALPSERLATEILLQAQEFFGEEVYLDFDAPVYKVRVGNARTREQAEALRARALSAGYGGAWIVETQVDARRAVEPWQLELAGEGVDADTAAVEGAAEEPGGQ